MGAELGGQVVGVGGGKKCRPPRTDLPVGLGRDDAARIAGVFVHGLEVQSTDRVLHIELVLNVIGNLLGRADEKQIVGNLVGVGRPRPHSQAGEILLLGLAGAVRVGSDVFLIIVLAVARGLGAAKVE